MTTHPAPARRGAHLVFQRQPAAVAQPPAAPPAEPPPPAAAAAPKATPKPRQRTHRVEPREAPGWAAWLAGWLLWAGGALATLLLWLVGSVGTTIVDGPLSYYGLITLNQAMAAGNGGAPPLSADWMVWLVFGLIFGAANGTQWHITFYWDEWTDGPMQVLKLILLLFILAIPAGALHLLLATLGGYEVTGTVPADLRSFSRAPLIGWGLFAFFFSIIVQIVGTRRLRHMADAGKRGGK